MSRLTEFHRDPDKRNARLTWDDGHTADFDYDYLRGYCPCAGCQGHGALGIRFYPVAQQVDLVSVEPVGRYGLSLHWSDGHATGIYRFDFLRRICPCADCAEGREDEHPTVAND